MVAVSRGSGLHTIINVIFLNGVVTLNFSADVNISHKVDGRVSLLVDHMAVDATFAQNFHHI